LRTSHNAVRATFVTALSREWAASRGIVVATDPVSADADWDNGSPLRSIVGVGPEGAMELRAAP
jgi:hypothetical protein